MFSDNDQTVYIASLPGETLLGSEDFSVLDNCWNCQTSLVDTCKFPTHLIFKICCPDMQVVQYVLLPLALCFHQYYQWISCFQVQLLFCLHVTAASRWTKTRSFCQVPSYWVLCLMHRCIERRSRVKRWISARFNCSASSMHSACESVGCDLERFTRLFRRCLRPEEGDGDEDEASGGGRGAGGARSGQGREKCFSSD